MTYVQGEISSLRNTYSEIREEVVERLSEFREIWESRDEHSALLELLFCILTPQSKAQVCWGAIEDMSCSDVLLKGDYDLVLGAVSMVRFKYKKARYLIEARERFMKNGNIELLSFLEGLGDPIIARSYLVENIKGLGYKEASHFLRNIGLGRDLTILDRHILRTLLKAGVIEEMPASLTDRRYLEIEGRMKEFSEKIDIPVEHLDVVIWYRSTGSIFK